VTLRLTFLFLNRISRGSIKNQLKVAVRQHLPLALCCMPASAALRDRRLYVGTFRKTTTIVSQ
jgi:hypothetical protein